MENNIECKTDIAELRMNVSDVHCRKLGVVWHIT
jgi:hypothetical protein